VLLRSIALPVLSCHEVSGATIEKCRACASEAATQLRQGWRKAIGAPDYRAYLAHHAARHPGVKPLNEREYVKMYIERRYNRRGAGRCC
jgi:uncharacterized short protein YbdD (DUF466 family)